MRGGGRSPRPDSMSRTIGRAGLIAIIATSASACVSVARMPDEVSGPSSSEQQVSDCGFVAHLKCIYLTGAETVGDGMDLKWTRHWFRMSYIGRACEREQGRTTAVVLESIFAVPHYLWIGIGNSTGVLLSPIRLFSAEEAGEHSMGTLHPSGSGPVEDPDGR